mmetsp:Transcript_2780/g.7195  ORF Transcript_2780/g.7195 Transcript_2780/m.7195 type:complete len:207 (-) Transcript_2780:27-647(-)
MAVHTSIALRPALGLILTCPIPIHLDLATCLWVQAHARAEVSVLLRLGRPRAYPPAESHDAFVRAPSDVLLGQPAASRPKFAMIRSPVDRQIVVQPLHVEVLNIDCGWTMEVVPSDNALLIVAVAIRVIRAGEAVAMTDATVAYRHGPLVGLLLTNRCHGQRAQGEDRDAEHSGRTPRHAWLSCLGAAGRSHRSAAAPHLPLSLQS